VDARSDGLMLCPDCHGVGVLTTTHAYASDRDRYHPAEEEGECPACEGRGRVDAATYYLEERDHDHGED